VTKDYSFVRDCSTVRVAKREWGINLPAENPCDMVTLNMFDDFEIVIKLN